MSDYNNYANSNAGDDQPSAEFSKKPPVHQMAPQTEPFVTYKQFINNIVWLEDRSYRGGVRQVAFAVEGLGFVSAQTGTLKSKDEPMEYSHSKNGEKY
ncbi:hypothetical protein G7Y89_g7415 [Cudoniella acicularis]|uniref:Uncharacterized protein n=1 Tax=Cudoniella acicularis TaxID=354080 RepID=A0A8H4RK57_9HELO|nr:hypothetical protein G7Y89_g7415 [Cudoniella acicularis]